MKVLIVEDDAPSRSFMKDTIESQGLEVHIAENGEEGLATFKKINPQLVLSDINMPKMDGLELLSEIRKISPRAIVVMVTAFGCEEYAMKALELKANNYLKKPVRHAELLPLLKKYESLTKEKPENKPQPSQTKKPTFSIKMDSVLEEVPDMVDWLIKSTGNYLDESGQLDAKIGLVELLNNAIAHGNWGSETNGDANQILNRARQVRVEYKTSETYCEWTISDEGKGFDWESYMERLDADPLGQTGKGILCCKFHFSELLYNSPGNSVTARKNKRSDC